jgi:hypothetical protein
MLIYGEYINLLKTIFVNLSHVDPNFFSLPFYFRFKILPSDPFKTFICTLQSRTDNRSYSIYMDLT